MTATIRHRHYARFTGLIKGSGSLRVAKYNNVEHVVVPVVAMIGDQVIWPVNAPTAEYVPASVVCNTPQIWNDRPVVPNHPNKDGHYHSATNPATLEAMCFGRVFNAYAENGKLKMEAWLDPSRAEVVGDLALDVIARLKANEMIEVSIGAWVSTVDQTGVFDGKEYGSVWTEISSDHLAILPKNVIGACSIEQGCGALRTNTNNDKQIDNGGIIYETEEDYKPMTVAAVATEKPNENKLVKPKTKPVDSMKARFNTFMRLMAGEDGNAADVAEETAEMVQYGVVKTMLEQSLAAITLGMAQLDQLISGEADDSAVSGDEDAEETVEEARLRAINSLVLQGASTAYGAVSVVYDLLKAYRDKPSVIDVVIVGDERYYKAKDQKTDKDGKSLAGKRNNKNDAKMIQTMHDNSVKLGADCASGDVKASESRSDRPCGCSDLKANESTNEEVVNVSATNEKKPEDAKDVKANAAAPAAAVETPAVATPPAIPAGMVLMSANEAEFLRGFMAKMKANEDGEKAALVKQLSTAQNILTVDQLNAKSLADLQEIRALCGVPPIDYSIRGMANGGFAPESDVDDSTATDAPDAYGFKWENGQLVS